MVYAVLAPIPGTPLCQEFAATIALVNITNLVRDGELIISKYISKIGGTGIG
jgi:hypothetical protein